MLFGYNQGTANKDISQSLDTNLHMVAHTRGNMQSAMQV